jgi:hypothetical protein
VSDNKCTRCYPWPCICDGGKPRLRPDEPPVRNPHTLVRAPTDAKERKAMPLASGVLDYFPDALLAVAALSKVGNDQHNPGKPLHWDRTKSLDHADCILRHMVDRGTIDIDNVRHSTKVAWRALALLQVEIENEREAKGVPQG